MHVTLRNAWYRLLCTGACTCCKRFFRCSITSSAPNYNLYLRAGVLLHRYLEPAALLAPQLIPPIARDALPQLKIKLRPICSHLWSPTRALCMTTLNTRYLTSLLLNFIVSFQFIAGCHKPLLEHGRFSCLFRRLDWGCTMANHLKSSPAARIGSKASI